MSRFIFLRGTRRNTTYRIVQDIASVFIEKMNIMKLAKMLATTTSSRDIIIHDDLGWHALVLVLIKKVKGYKIVIRLRGDAFLVLKTGPYKWSYLPRKITTEIILRSADFVLFNSRHVRDKPEYQFAKDCSDIVQNPLMIEHLCSNSEPSKLPSSAKPGLRLLTVTNFNMRLKVAPLKDALLNWIDPEYMIKNDLYWEIVGGGSYFREFVKEIQPDRFLGRLNFQGHQESVSKFYFRSDIFVYISGLDAFPNAVMEASYSELPIIVSDGSEGALDAMLPNETGLVISGKTSFQDAIRYYQSNPDMRERHGTAARKFVVENFSVAQQTKKTSNVLLDFFNVQLPDEK